MEKWKLDAWAHGKSGTEKLCNLLLYRQGDKTDRLLAAQFLGYAKTNLRAAQCLASVAMWRGDDPPRWSRVLEDVMRSETEPLPRRKLALEALIYLLTDSHSSTQWDGRSAWDSVASIALAKSDPPQLRSVAESAMRQRPHR